MVIALACHARDRGFDPRPDCQKSIGAAIKLGKRGKVFISSTVGRMLNPAESRRYEQRDCRRVDDAG